MTTVEVVRDIAAPTDVVFAAVSDVANLPRIDSAIRKIEFLGEQRAGVGTRFRETRVMGKDKEMVTELEVTEHVDGERVRMVTDSHGTVWDTVFVVSSLADESRLVVTMTATPHKLLPKLLNPLMKGVFRRGMEKHFDGVKRYCEGRER